jgi:glycosyltransferase involved in cell wall biosynthesis
LRIVITTHQLSRGGKEKQLMVLAKGLQEKKYDVLIISTKQLKKDNYYHEYEFPVQQIKCLENKSYISGFFKFKREVLNFKPDAIITFDIQTTLWTIWIQYFKKIIFFNHSIQRGTPYEGKERHIMQYVAKKSPINIANSLAGLQMLGLNQNKSNRIIRSPLDLKPSNETIDFKSIFGVNKPANASVLITMGSVSLHKGQHTIINALQLLENKDLFLIVLGEGPNLEYLESKTAKSNLSPNIKFLGQVDNIEKYLRISDLYIHASKGEGSSNAILEAIAAELPVISTLTGGTKEIAEAVRIEGFTYDDHEDLARKINLFIQGDIKASDKDEMQKSYLTKDEYVHEFITLINANSNVNNTQY